MHDSHVDTVDRAIIGQLQLDCRITNTDLADRVGLTPSPCLRRIRRLEEDGVILGYHARVAPEAVGRAFEVLIDLELTDTAQPTVETFETALVAFDEIVEARRMFGAPDYHALVAVADLAAYEQFLTRRLMALPGLARVQSRFPMKTMKSAWPTPT